MHFIKTNNLLERRNYDKVRNLIANDQTEIDNENRFLRLIVTKQQCMKQQSPYPSTYGGRNKTRTNMIYSCLNIVKMT